MQRIERILSQMSNVSKPQKKFLRTLFCTIFMLRGRMNFRNLSRYSDLHENTYLHNFRTPFDFEVIRKNTTLSFYIGKKKVWHTTYPNDMVQRFGLRPWRATMQVYDFSASGKFQEFIPFHSLFISGKDGYHTYRIPALIVTKRNTLLAFCEGRKNSLCDDGDIDMLVKRSEDGGVTTRTPGWARRSAWPVTSADTRSPGFKTI